MPESLYSIPLDTAIEYTTRWRQTHSLKAFTIDVAELYDIIDELGQGNRVKGVRVYFGYKEDGSEALVLVGVDDRENDILNIPGEGEDAEVNPGTYDFTRPCPSTCDNNDSPLAGD